MIQGDRFLTAKEVAALFGISVNTVHNGGGGTRHLKRLRLPDSDAVRFLESEVMTVRERIIAAATDAQKKRVCRRCGR